MMKQIDKLPMRKDKNFSIVWTLKNGLLISYKLSRQFVMKKQDMFEIILKKLFNVSHEL